MAEAHCGRGEADRRTARSHVTLALPLRGLACLLAGGSHSPLAAMASADGRKHIAMSLEAPSGKLQKGFLWKWLVVRYNGLDHEEVGILNGTSS
jgi:hypothetical protein